MAFVIKEEVNEPRTKTFVFAAAATMYGGRHIAVGDTVYVFASESEGGQGLVARGVDGRGGDSKGARHCPSDAVRQRRDQTHGARQAPARTKRPQALQGLEGRPAPNRADFKSYRLATNKIGGISDEAAAFLDGF